MKLKLLPSTIPSHSFPLRDSHYNASSSSSSVHRQKLNFIVAAKSKKKHHKDSQGSDSQPSPPRITSNPKQNLRILKTLKDFQKRQTTTPRTGPSYSYRKKKAEKKKAEKKNTQGEEDPYRVPTSSVNHTKELGIINNNDVPVYLIDGYNVCGYWLKLKKYFMNGQLELARQLLIDELKSFSMTREVKVVVVFDAMMSGFRTHKERAAGVDIVFSCDTSADTWIEREVSALKEVGCSEVWVVTSDHSMGESAYFSGAFVWSCKTFVTEIEESQKEADEMRQERSSAFHGSLLKYNLDPKVVDALRNLRQKLTEKEINALKNPRQKLSEKESK